MDTNHPLKDGTTKIAVEDDGSTHINIYSQGKTKLGRKLSHFAKTPFRHPFFGPFESMEGFWYYMRGVKIVDGKEQRDDQLRYLCGFEAKQYGRQLKAKWYDDFWEDILAANYQKIIQNEEIRDMMINSTLPFKHYYVFGPHKVVINARDHEKLTEGMEEIRRALVEDRPSKEWERAEKRYVAMSSSGRLLNSPSDV